MYFKFHSRDVSCGTIRKGGHPPLVESWPNWPIQERRTTPPWHTIGGLFNCGRMELHFNWLTFICK